jgi:hypothetical protein
VTVVLFPAHEPFVEVLRAHAIETKTPVDLTDLEHRSA